MLLVILCLAYMAQSHLYHPNNFVYCRFFPNPWAHIPLQRMWMLWVQNHHLGSESSPSRSSQRPRGTFRCGGSAALLIGSDIPLGNIDL